MPVSPAPVPGGGWEADVSQTSDSAATATAWRSGAPPRVFSCVPSTVPFFLVRRSKRPSCTSHSHPELHCLPQYPVHREAARLLFLFQRSPAACRSFACDASHTHCSQTPLDQPSSPHPVVLYAGGRL